MARMSRGDNQKIVPSHPLIDDHQNVKNAATEKNGNRHMMDAVELSEHGTQITKFRIVVDMRDDMVISAPPLVELIDHRKPL